MSNTLENVNMGYKVTDLGELPKTWEVIKLSELTSKILDGTHATPKYVDSGVKFLSVENITRNNYLNTKYVTHEAHKEYSKRCKVEKDDILMTRIGSIGNVKLVDWDFETSIYVSLALIKLKNKEQAKYISQYMKSGVFRKEILKRSLLNAAPMKINLGDIGEIPIIIPPLEEQKKIAEILSAIDEQILQTEQLIEKTEKLKRGSKQRLLTKGIGHKDFKSIIFGEIPKDWKLANLEDVSNFITKGSTPTTYGFDWQETGIHFFKSDVVKNGKFVYGDYKFIGEDAHQHMLRSQIKSEDILMTITGNIGRVAIVPPEIERANINQHVARITIENSNMIPSFVFHWLSQPKLVEYYTSIKTGQAYPQISLKQVRETPIPVPSLEEQQKIADILSSIDKQIDNYNKEKEKQIELKKALMQQLLTGKIRVTV